MSTTSNNVKGTSLKYLAEGKVEGVQKATTFKVHPDKVEFEEGFNLREEGPALDAHLERLYVAMKAGASIPAIDVIVSESRIIARDGHCRTRVAKRLIAEGIPYVLEARQFRGNEADQVFHMLGSAEGKPLTPLEQGRGFLRLINYKLTVAQIVARTGLTRTSVDNGLMLAEAPVQVQMLINGGAVSCQVALDALRKHGAKAGEVLEGMVTKVKATGASKVTKKHVSGPRVPLRIVQSFVSAAGAMRNAIGTKRFKKLMTDDIADDTLIEVPAAQLKALLTAHAELGENTKLRGQSDEL